MTITAIINIVNNIPGTGDFFFCANGSPTFNILGYLAREVSVAPKRLFTIIEELIAHPLALRIGAKLRLRSFTQARNIDGPEITRHNPAITRSNVYQGFTRADPAFSIMPAPTPQPAVSATRVVASKGFFPTEALPLESTFPLAKSTRPPDTFDSFSAARLLIRSLMAFANFLYG